MPPAHVAAVRVQALAPAPTHVELALLLDFGLVEAALGTSEAQLRRVVSGLAAWALVPRCSENGGDAVVVCRCMLDFHRLCASVNRPAFVWNKTAQQKTRRVCVCVHVCVHVCVCMCQCVRFSAIPFPPFLGL